MNMSAKLLFAMILLAGGNSWATGNLSSGFHTPQNSTLVVTIWIKPFFEGETPEVCNAVKIIPLKALKDMVNSSASSSTDTVDVELVALHLTSIDPVGISPGQIATIYIRNTDFQAQTYHLGFLVEPPIAHKVCGAKASAQVLLDGVVPVGAPVDLTDNFNSTRPENDNINR